MWLFLQFVHQTYCDYKATNVKYLLRLTIFHILASILHLPNPFFPRTLLILKYSQYYFSLSFKYVHIKFAPLVHFKNISWVFSSLHMARSSTPCIRVTLHSQHILEARIVGYEIKWSNLFSKFWNGPCSICSYLLKYWSNNKQYIHI